MCFALLDFNLHKVLNEVLPMKCFVFRPSSHWTKAPSPGLYRAVPTAQEWHRHRPWVQLSTCPKRMRWKMTAKWRLKNNKMKILWTSYEGSEVVKHCKPLSHENSMVLRMFNCPSGFPKRSGPHSGIELDDSSIGPSGSPQHLKTKKMSKKMSLAQHAHLTTLSFWHVDIVSLRVHGELPRVPAFDLCPLAFTCTTSLARTWITTQKRTN